MTAYYNEFDPFAANWLRELIKDGLIAPGVVDERSITEVIPSDLSEFTQCHFFAGIGGWSIALRLAGWPDDRPVWTGSPPCQPFSVAGNKKGTDDDRHLWPAFFDLIREQAPPTVFGEQVASAIRHGWFDDLQTDLENQNYASAMAVLPACSVGAPQKRDRLWYVANKLANTDHDRQSTSCGTGQSGEQPEAGDDLGWSGQTSPMANPDVLGRLESLQPLPGKQSEWVGGDSLNGRDGSMGDTDDARLQMHGGHGELHIRKPYWSGENGHGSDSGFFNSTLANFIYCRDGKARPAPIEPTLFPLANGVSNRVGILRGAGNAIVPQVAAEVIKAFMEFEVNK